VTEGAGLGSRIDLVRGLWTQSQRRDVDSAGVNFALVDELTGLAPDDVEDEEAYIAKVAELADIPAERLLKVWRIGSRYRHAVRVQGIAWSAYEVLASRADRYDLIARMLDDPEWPEGWREGRRVKGNRITADRARLASGQQMDRKALSDAAVALGALEKADVRKEFLALEGVTRAERVAKAAAERREKELLKEAERAEKDKVEAQRKALREAEKLEALPRPGNPLEQFSRLIKRLRGYAVAMAEAAEVAPRLPVRPPEYREAVLSLAYEASQLAGKVIVILDPIAERPGLPNPNTIVVDP
jgi:hypothetical protein